ncbi:hypothetical protein DSO57_1027829 [Entomophthora muscae]|uniref:Uncharacterized protein n=1 Tax=Entomophthora muscae TaxID=34485 RepID=A0ACC2RGA8_9FUNG|nr:hypothetical protein DSO57_1027829 [Entomophthora muscae]
MVGIPVGSSLVGFHPTALLHYLGSLLSQEWIPDSNTVKIYTLLVLGSGTRYPEEVIPLQRLGT